MDIILSDIKCSECKNTEDVLIEFNEEVILWLCKKCLLRAVQRIGFTERCNKKEK